MDPSLSSSYQLIFEALGFLFGSSKPGIRGSLNQSRAGFLMNACCLSGPGRMELSFSTVLGTGGNPEMFLLKVTSDVLVSHF